MLNRVNYTRVFDLAGVVEAVDEVANSWKAQAQQTNDKIKAKIKVIEDSEEEGEDDVDDDEDELDQNLSKGNDQDTTEKTDRQVELQQRKSIQERVPIDMIVIDTISNVVTSVMSKSQVQGIF